MAAAALNPADVQGLVVRGYGRLPAARYLVGAVEDPASARAWLADLEVATGAPGERDSALNVALSAPGLAKLGAAVDGFSREFADGMRTEHRARLLGDDPADWTWGDEPADVLLLAYGRDDRAVRAHGFPPGIRLVRALDTIPLTPFEHFGFRDGISQPRLAELGGEGPARDSVAAGEFVLGHRNEYGRITPHPPLGRNGSYLVLRQLEQDVDGFWDWCRTAAPEDPERLAAKVVGRRRDGAPLVPARDAVDFAYQAADPHGLRCPVGAHVRRANPRDTLDPEPGSERSIAVNRRHRLLRRGRQYGTAPGPRGLHFICLVANLSRQFEFVQHSWLNDPRFDGLRDQPDALTGPGGGVFTIPAEPVRERFTRVPRFVTTRGGAYFLLPGVQALRSLA